MAPNMSLRTLLSYANRVFSQAPLLSGLSNSFSHDADHSVSQFNDQTYHDQQPMFGGISPYEPLSGAPSCPIDGPVSCSGKGSADSCCVLYPGGRLLLTQFWDDKTHVEGGEEDWTLHGLWPDKCDGSYDQFCDMTPRYNNITAILEHYDQKNLLDCMNRYWVADYGTNEHLWEHEFNKHGTCINTLATSCYGDAYTPGAEVVDYFVRAFELFRTLDTFSVLKRAGIEPDSSKTYALDDIQNALEDFSSSRVILKCSQHGVLHEAWYVFFVVGSLQSGEIVPARDSFRGDHSNCPAHIKYLPKRSR